MTFCPVDLSILPNDLPIQHIHYVAVINGSSTALREFKIFEGTPESQRVQCMVKCRVILGGPAQLVLAESPVSSTRLSIFAGISDRPDSARRIPNHYRDLDIPDRNVLFSLFIESLQVASRYNIRSIGFDLTDSNFLSGFSIGEKALIAHQAIKEFALQHPGQFDHVRLVVPGGSNASIGAVFCYMDTSHLVRPERFGFS